MTNWCDFLHLKSRAIGGPTSKPNCCSLSTSVSFFLRDYLPLRFSSTTYNSRHFSLYVFKKPIRPHLETAVKRDILRQARAVAKASRKAGPTGSDLSNRSEVSSRMLCLEVSNFKTPLQDRRPFTPEFQVLVSFSCADTIIFLDPAKKDS